MTQELPEWGRGPVLREFRAVGKLPGADGDWVLAAALLLIDPLPLREPLSPGESPQPSDPAHSAADRRGLGREVIGSWAAQQAEWLEGAELAHGCEACGSPGHGRPRLHKDGHELPARLSYSRAQVSESLPCREDLHCAMETSARANCWVALALLAFRTDAGELPAGFGVGVDLEPSARRAEMSGEAWKEFAFSQEERRRLEALSRAEGPELESAEALRLWTRKEAFVKAVGTGLRADPREIDTAAWGRCFYGYPQAAHAAREGRDT